MKESTAWQILAEEHDAGTTSWYLCNTLTHPDVYSPRLAAGTSHDLRQAMIARIKYDLNDKDPAYDGDEITPEEEREARVLACLMFAEQARDEEKAGT